KQHPRIFIADLPQFADTQERSNRRRTQPFLHILLRQIDRFVPGNTRARLANGSHPLDYLHIWIIIHPIMDVYQSFDTRCGSSTNTAVLHRISISSLTEFRWQTHKHRSHPLTSLPPRTKPISQTRVQNIAEPATPYSWKNSNCVARSSAWQRTDA